jgi:hypothetical protein
MRNPHRCAWNYVLQQTARVVGAKPLFEDTNQHQLLAVMQQLQHLGDIEPVLKKIYHGARGVNAFDQIAPQKNGDCGVAGFVAGDVIIYEQ